MSQVYDCFHSTFCGDNTNAEMRDGRGQNYETRVPCLGKHLHNIKSRKKVVFKSKKMSSENTSPGVIIDFSLDMGPGQKQADYNTVPFVKETQQLMESISYIGKLPGNFKLLGSKCFMKVFNPITELNLKTILICTGKFQNSIPVVVNIP